jgi:hypothetical protein
MGNDALPSVFSVHATTSSMCRALMLGWSAQILVAHFAVISYKDHAILLADVVTGDDLV